MLDKPPIGAPCNGCGLCCLMEVCSSGAVMLGFTSQWGERVPGPCPALVEDGEKLVCGILQRPEHYVRPGRGPKALRDAMSLLLGVGLGCDVLGDESPETGLPKLDAVAQLFEESTNEKDLANALRVICGL
jgi:hypothetical protein